VAVEPTDLYKYSPDVVPPIHAVSYDVATDKPPPPKMETSSGLFLATIYNQSQLAERKHVARYWLINTAATAVPLSAHPSPLVITAKLAAAILGGGCSEEVFCRPSTAPAVYPTCWLAAGNGNRPLQLCNLPLCATCKVKRLQRKLTLTISQESKITGEDRQKWK